MSQSPTRNASFVGQPTELLSRGEAGHVLVADGDSDSRERRTLELRAAGFRVSAARTGFEAIVKASCQVPDLIVLDDSLPDLAAAETGRLITTCPVTAHIPVLRVTHGRRLPRRLFTKLRRQTS